METNMGKYKTYTPEFKLEAITLAKTQGVTKTAINLGIKKAVTCLDLTAAPSGLVASLPKKLAKICVYP
jgi:hypothetical protein